VIKKAVLAVAALAFMAAAIVAAVAAATFALYALLRPELGPPLAAAVVALVFAVIAAVVALVLTRRARGPRHDEAEPSLMERVMGMARERPVLAAGGALAAALIALKNPQVVASIVSAVLAARTAEKVDRSRR